MRDLRQGQKKKEKQFKHPNQNLEKKFKHLGSFLGKVTEQTGGN